jgi:hypothetical protein
LQSCPRTHARINDLAVTESCGNTEQGSNAREVSSGWGGAASATSRWSRGTRVSPSIHTRCPPPARDVHACARAHRFLPGWLLLLPTRLTEQLGHHLELLFLVQFALAHDDATNGGHMQHATRGSRRRHGCSSRSASHRGHRCRAHEHAAAAAARCSGHGRRRTDQQTRHHGRKEGWLDAEEAIGVASL